MIISIIILTLIFFRIIYINLEKPNLDNSSTNSSFDYSLIKETNKNKSSNYLISPYSIKTVLSIIKDGADNSSLKELNDVMGNFRRANIISKNARSGKLEVITAEKVSITPSNRVKSFTLKVLLGSPVDFNLIAKGIFCFRLFSICSKVNDLQTSFSSISLVLLSSSCLRFKISSFPPALWQKQGYALPKATKCFAKAR